VKINQIGVVTVRDYDSSYIDAPEDLDGEQQHLVIDQQKYFNFRIKNVDDAQTKPKLMDTAMRRAAYAMNDVIDAFAANLLAVNVSATTVIGSDTIGVFPENINVYGQIDSIPNKLDSMLGQKSLC